MKKPFKKLLLLLFSVSLSIFLGCSGDEEEPAAEVAIPTVSISAVNIEGVTVPNGGEIYIGNALTLSVSILAAGGINTIYISGDVESSTLNRNDLGLSAGTTDVSFDLELSLSGTSDLQEGIITFEVVDDLDQKGSASFSFVTIAIPSPTAMTQTAVMLYTPLGSLTSETFYSISENKTYSRKSVESTSDPVSPLIDFGYYYGATNKASLASPSGYPSAIYDLSSWGTINKTTLVATAITSAEYLEIVTVAAVETAIEGIDLSAAPQVATELIKGAVLAFESASGSKGFILVNEITGTDGADGTITLEIKLAEAGQ
ncbi:MAG: hypothetical protein HQ474_01870 [Flammeovirgaceae bacterium]|jgi:hypothetical protein|nr:hypothetical protein [Flammeovirgaceae bacterium]|tara:strand:- start:6471 stop:7418 length:948 start_codon:yes stop_codon:yes gene_type:complete